MNVFDRKNETMTREQIEQIQLERIQALLARLRRNVRRYRELLGDARVSTLADMARLPMTTPESLIEAFPYGMFALPLREVVRLHSSVGPGGNPIVLGYSRNDLAQWARLAARQLVAAGVSSTDVLQIAFEGGMFNAAFGYMLGAELVGASVTPQAPFHTEYQLEVLRNYRTTVLITTPSNARALAEQLEAAGVDPQSLHLRTVILSRPIRPEEREALETGLFARVRIGLGIAEIASPGFALECDHGHFHVQEDHFYVELVNGELVVTTLVREAMPLLRYGTRIAARLEAGRCPCGRTGLWIEPGERLDNRLLINEIPLYREQIAAVLARTKAAGQPFRLEVGERGIVIDIEVSENFFADEMRVLAELKAEIRSDFLARLGIECEVRYVSRVDKDAGAKTG